MFSFFLAGVGGVGWWGMGVGGRANLGAFTFVGFALVWFCLFSLPLGVWEGLPLVNVALPGLSFTFVLVFRIATAVNEYTPVYYIITGIVTAIHLRYYNIIKLLLI